jgi:hypothetical protein
MKMTKSYLKFAKEFQSCSYYMMFAYTSIMFTRYLFLAMESRESQGRVMFIQVYQGFLSISVCL